MKTPLCLVILATTALSAFGSEPIHAATKDGRAFLLLADGTWREESNAEKALPIRELGVGEASIKGKRGKYAVFYMDKFWKAKPADEDPWDIQFSSKDGDGYGGVIFERTEVPIDTLRAIALANAQKAAPDAEIVEEAEVSVNGKKLLRLQMKGTVQKIKFVYFGYYGSGDWGTVQFITYTSANLFREYKPHFEKLLDGLVILDEGKG